MTSIYQRGNRRILFVHIPKTGGTSVRSLLEKNNWQPAEVPPIPPNRRSEIHGIADSHHRHRSLINLWDKTWEYEFGLVRNPYDRFVSRTKTTVRDIVNSLNVEPSNLPAFSDLALRIWEYLITELFGKEGIGTDDNHWRPQSEFTSLQTRIFKLESQKDEMMNELIEREIISPDSVIEQKNISKDFCSSSEVDWHTRPELHEAFVNFYRDDFEEFKYDVLNL